jgi:shikimate kinase
MASALRHVVLVGLSGSGKSTIGRLLARRLGRAFVDTDDLIVERAGKPIPAVFAQDGEAEFRRIEREAVAAALERPPAVIATGGGAPVDEGNRRALWDGNLVVWLDAPVEVLVSRVGEAGTGRPLLADGPAARLAALRAAREAIYATAHLRVDTAALDTAAAADAILRALEDRQ